MPGARLPATSVRALSSRCPRPCLPPASLSLSLSLASCWRVFSFFAPAFCLQAMFLLQASPFREALLLPRAFQPGLWALEGWLPSWRKRFPFNGVSTKAKKTSPLHQLDFSSAIALRNAKLLLRTLCSLPCSRPFLFRFLCNVKKITSLQFIIAFTCLQMIPCCFVLCLFLWEQPASHPWVCQYMKGRGGSRLRQLLFSRLPLLSLQQF